MIEATYTSNNTKVKNSYLLTTKKGIEQEVEWIKSIRKARKLPVTRSTKSYVREWRGHSRLYKKGLFKSHTKDVDLNENNSIIEEIIWFILGGI